jgi:hypothetical protein
MEAAIHEAGEFINQRLMHAVDDREDLLHLLDILGVEPDEDDDDEGTEK